MENIDFFIILKIGFLITLLGFSAFFSSSETAFFSLGKLNFQKIQQQNSKLYIKVLNFLKNPQDVIISTLLGNEIVNTSISLIFASLIYDFYSAKPWWYITILSTSIITPILLIFGEIGPKSIAIKNPVKSVLFLYPPFSAFYRIISPIRFPISKILSKTDFVFVSEKDTASVMEDEFKSLVAVSEKEGVIEKSEHDLIKKVIELGDKPINEIMTHRADMFSVPSDISFYLLLQEIRKYKYSRIPVYHKSKDNIIGILHTKDLLPHARLKTPQKNFRIKRFLRPPYFVPLSKKSDLLFKEFNQKKLHLAIVVDEYGGISGLITMEDLLEELFGEIRDEYDDIDWEYDTIDESNYKVSAKMNVKKFFTLLDLEFCEKDFQKIKTVGGFLFSLHGKLPDLDEIITYKNINLKVTKLEGTRLIEITVFINSLSPLIADSENES